MEFKKLTFTCDDLLILSDDPVYEDLADDGRGEYVQCALCKARGWKDELTHAKICPLHSDLVASVTVTLNLDPEKICPKCKGLGSVRWTEQDHSESQKCGMCGGSGRKPEKAPKMHTCPNCTRQIACDGGPDAV